MCRNCTRYSLFSVGTWLNLLGSKSAVLRQRFIFSDHLQWTSYLGEINTLHTRLITFIISIITFRLNFNFVTEIAHCYFVRLVVCWLLIKIYSDSDQLKEEYEHDESAFCLSLSLSLEFTFTSFTSHLFAHFNRKKTFRSIIFKIYCCSENVHTRTPNTIARTVERRHSYILCVFIHSAR